MNLLATFYDLHESVNVNRYSKNNTAYNNSTVSSLEQLSNVSYIYSNDPSTRYNFDEKLSSINRHARGAIIPRTLSSTIIFFLSFFLWFFALSTRRTHLVKTISGRRLALEPVIRLPH